jgi:hypothetical protein
VYGFIFNSNSGIGNPAANVTSIITAGTESGRVGASGGWQIGNGVTGGDEGAGTLNLAGAYYQAGTVGVTCSGPPTASFASKLGIVTHC